MHSPGRGVLRWARAALLVGLTVLVSLGGHVLAGGEVHLSVPALLGVLALAAGCVAAADTRREAGEILPVVLLAQPVLHLLASMGPHQHAAGASLHSGLLAEQSVPAGGTSLTPLMVAAHVAAAVVLSVLLASADRVLWALASLRVRVRVPAPVPPPVPSPGPLPLLPRGACLPARSALRSSPRLRRGPPVVGSAL